MTPSRGIGIIGLGGIALNHLDAYRTRGFRVVAGCDTNPATFDRVHTEFGVTRLTASLDEFLSIPGLDVVDLAVPHYLEIRKPIFEAVARAGKALFCQKPLDETFAGALELVRIVEKAGIQFAVNQNAPFVPGFRLAERILRDRDRFGSPFWFQVENRGPLWFDSHPHYGTRDRWILAGMAVHHLALAQAWFGTPARVWATLAHDPSKPGIKAENVAAVGLEYGSGLKGLIINNWSYPGPRPRAHPQEEIVVLGSRGALTLDSRETVFDPASGPRETLTAEGTWFNDAFGESMRAFLSSLDGGPPHPSAGRADLEVMATLEAAYRSSSTGRSVSPAEILAGS